MIKARFDPRAFDKLEFTRRQVHRVIFASHVDLDRNVRQENPFDTGFSASSWWPQVDGAPASHPNPPEKGNPGGGRGSSDPAVLLESVGHVLTLANSAPYIRRLADGYSPQAAAGWIDKIANDYQDYVMIHCAEEAGKGPS